MTAQLDGENEPDEYFTECFDSDLGGMSRDTEVAKTFVDGLNETELTILKAILIQDRLTRRLGHFNMVQRNRMYERVVKGDEKP